MHSPRFHLLTRCVAALACWGACLASAQEPTAVSDPAFEAVSKLIKAGDFAGAKTPLEQLAAKYPEAPEIWLSCGTNAEKLGERPAALGFYLKGCHVAPGAENKMGGRCREAVVRLVGAAALPVLNQAAALQTEARRVTAAEEKKRLLAAVAALDQLLINKLK